jgi:HSP20 family molecular chaperone IbpA
MWSRAVALLDEAERRHRRFFELLVTPSRRQPAWEPPVDIFSHDEGLHVVVAMPGARPEDVSVELLPTALVVRAESRLPLRAARARILRLEIPYGHIERRIELPGGHLELRGRELVDGCLHLHLALGEPR